MVSRLLCSPLRRVHFPTLLDRFPSNVAFTFAYGSGAFQQNNHQDKSKNMLDIVLVVENLEDFHRQNIQRNKRDYAWWNRIAKIDDLCEYQRKTGNRVWWHPYVKGVLPNNQELKYGVIEFSDFKRDMTEWSDL